MLEVCGVYPSCVLGKGGRSASPPPMPAMTSELDSLGEAGYLESGNDGGYLSACRKGASFFSKSVVLCTDFSCIDRLMDEVSACR